MIWLALTLAAPLVPPMQLDPLALLKDAVKAVPAVKYALGVGGLLAVVALVGALGLDPRLALYGTILVLLLMTVLVVFARLTAIAPAFFLLPAQVLTWSSLLLVVGASSLLFTSVFFKWPVDLRFWLDKRLDATIRYERASNSTLDIALQSVQSWKLPPGNLFRSLDIELRAINHSDLPVPLDPSATFTIAGRDGMLKTDVMLELASGSDSRGAVLAPLVPTQLFLAGKLTPNVESLLNQGLTAYVSVYYERKLSDTTMYFLSPFIPFDTTQVQMHGG